MVSLLAVAAIVAFFAGLWLLGRWLEHVRYGTSWVGLSGRCPRCGGRYINWLAQSRNWLCRECWEVWHEWEPKEDG